MAKSPHFPRQVAVAIVIRYTPAGPEFLLITSRSHPEHYVLPKGGIEHGETPEASATRESWEEAGLYPDVSTHIAPIGIISDPLPHRTSKSQDPSHKDFLPQTYYHFHVFTVPLSRAVLAEEWPEREERKRKWVLGWDALIEAVSWGRRASLMSQAVKNARIQLDKCS